MNSNKKTKWILNYVLLIAIFFWIAGGDAEADFVFSVPEKLSPAVNTSLFESMVGVSQDGLSLYFIRGWNPYSLYVSTRINKDDPWGTAQFLGAFTLENFPTAASSIGSLSTVTTADGLEFYIRLTARLPGLRTFGATHAFTFVAAC